LWITGRNADAPNQFTDIGVVNGQPVILFHLFTRIEFNIS